jgi:hypothetical protein
MAARVAALERQERKVRRRRHRTDCHPGTKLQGFFPPGISETVPRCWVVLPMFFNMSTHSMSTVDF